MKVFIWVVCVFVYALIQTLLTESGIILGGIPTAILFATMMYVARTLSSKVGKKDSTT